jgi:hypothetical protein
MGFSHRFFSTELLNDYEKKAAVLFAGASGTGRL